MDWRKFLAPELQTDGSFATGVTRQTLLKPNENVQFQRWFFENFLGAKPPDPHTGEGLRRPSIVVSPLTKILATRLVGYANILDFGIPYFSTHPVGLVVYGIGAKAKYPNTTLQDERTLLNASIMAYGDLTNRKCSNY